MMAIMYPTVYFLRSFEHGVNGFFGRFFFWLLVLGLGWSEKACRRPHVDIPSLGVLGKATMMNTGAHICAFLSLTVYHDIVMRIS